MLNNYNLEIARNLLKLLERDYQVREELSSSGELNNGYHPLMESVHNQNADYLEKVISEIGWPNAELVGEEAAYAAWMILQHGVGRPNLMRKTLPILEKLATFNKIDQKEYAVIYDKICFFENRPQRYGTQFDYNEDNELVPWMIENVHQVDELRKNMGLPPLKDTTILMQKRVSEDELHYLKPFKVRQKERLKWAKKVGWL